MVCFLTILLVADVMALGLFIIGTVIKKSKSKKESLKKVKSNDRT